MALTKVTGSVIKDSVSLSGNVSVGGTLTYQDVTNVDALGIGTFRTGIKVLAGQVDVGSNIKLGNAGVITATSFSGVMSGTTGSFSGQVNVGSNIKLGTAGVITATSFVGSGANLTSLPAQATIANNADNRVITGGSGVNLNGEANFTFSGNTATITASSGYALVANGASTGIGLGSNGAIVFGNQNVAAYATGALDASELQFKTSGSERVRITSGGQLLIGTTSGGGTLRVFGGSGRLIIGDSSVNYHDADTHIFRNYAASEKLRINSSGITLINTTTATGAAKLQLLQTSGDGLLVRNHDTNYEGIILSNASGEARLMATSGGSTSRPSLTFYAGDTQRMKIDTGGRVILNNAAVGSNEYLTLGPNGSTPCDMAFRLNNDNDARIKFYDGGGTLRGVFGYTTYANNSTYPNFHDSFYLQTDPSSNGTLATALRISNSGQFIKPLTYQFLVETNGVSVSGGWTKLTGLTIDSAHSTGVSNGTYWSNSNQRFTAPVSGTYNFFIGGFSSTSEGGGTNHRYMYTFVINGGNYNYGLGGSYSDGNTPMEGGSINYKLTVNDYVEVYYYTAINATWGAGHRFFWGGYFLG